MKKLVIVIVVVMFNAGVYSQVKKPVPPKSNMHLRVFNMAITAGDLSTGINALNYYITEQGSNTPYADTLAMLYMQQGLFPQCYYWANMRLMGKPEDNILLEMKGVCLEKLQQPKEAIEIFEKLYGKTKSPYHGYKLMELQYSIKRSEECIMTALSAEKLQYKPENTMSYNVGEQTGRTYLQAGVYNIHALALYSLDRKAEAKVFFQKAVDLDSNFILARQNLEAVIAAEKGTGKLNPNNQPPLTNPGNKQN